MDRQRSAQDIMNETVQWVIDENVKVDCETIRFIADVAITITGLESE